MLKKIKENILYLLIIIQPLLDVFAYYAMDTKFSIFPFLIRSVIMLISTLYILIKRKNDKKYWAFLMIMGLFSLAHLINSHFTIGISLIGDIEELVRVVYMPLLAVNGHFYVKMDKTRLDQIKYGIMTNTFIIFAVIVLSVITNTSVPTYAEGIGLRGWFYNSNSQSIILCFCVPFTLYYCLKCKYTILKIVSIVIAFFLLYTNGTTACYLMIFPTFILAIYKSLLEKNKISRKVFEILILIVPIGAAIMLYGHSPEFKINEIAEVSFTETKEIFDKVDPQKPEKPIDKDTDLSDDITDKIDKYFDKNFVKDYGYDKIYASIGSNFDATHLVNNRYRKKLVASVVFEEAPFSTKLLGTGFSKIQYYNSDMESDYSAILYFFGYIGLILYLLLIAYTLYIAFMKFVRNPKMILNSEFIMVSALFCMLNLGAELSGSLLKRPNASMYVALVIMYILVKYKEEKNEKKRN